MSPLEKTAGLFAYSITQDVVSGQWLLIRYRRRSDSNFKRVQLIGEFRSWDAAAACAKADAGS